MMLDVEAKLQSRGFPITCVYGPERLPFEGFTSNLYRFERDPDTSDTVLPATGAGMAKRDQPQKAVRMLAVRVIVYGQSPLAGAQRHEHEHECEQLVDGLTVALSEWFSEAHASRIPFAVTEARYVTDAKEREAVYAEGWPGVVYALRFKVPRGVRALRYVSGAAPGLPRDKGVVEHVDNTIEISLDGTNVESV